MLLPLTSRIVFELFLFMKVVKLFLRPRAVTANSSQLFNLLAIFPNSRFPFIYRHSSHHKNVLFLIPRYDRPNRKGENRFVYSLFKTWRRKSIPRVKISNEKWKCEKEIAQKENLEKMY